MLNTNNLNFYFNTYIDFNFLVLGGIEEERIGKKRRNGNQERNGKNKERNGGR